MEIEAILFILVFTLHNIEEALWLPKWMEKHMPNEINFINIFTKSLGLPKLKNKYTEYKLSTREIFLFTDVCITLLGYLIVGMFILFPDTKYVELLYIGFVGVHFINAIVPHLLLTIKYHKYCPGVITGSFLLIPITSVILINALNNDLKIGEIIISSIIIGIFLVISLHIFPKISNKILDF